MRAFVVQCFAGLAFRSVKIVLPAPGTVAIREKVPRDDPAVIAGACATPLASVVDTAEESPVAVNVAPAFPTGFIVHVT